MILQLATALPAEPWGGPAGPARSKNVRLGLVRGNRSVDLTSATVLVVDDEDVVRRVTASVLRRLGYEVVEAATGSEGVRLGQEHAGKLDLLLTDMTMADVSGVEVAVAF